MWDRRELEQKTGGGSSACGFNVEDDNLQPCSAEEHQNRANFYRDRYAEFLESGEYSAASRLIRSKNLY